MDRVDVVVTEEGIRVQDATEGGRILADVLGEEGRDKREGGEGG